MTSNLPRNRGVDRLRSNKPYNVWHLTGRMVLVGLLLFFASCQKQVTEGLPSEKLAQQQDTSWMRYPLDTTIAENGPSSRVTTSVPGTAYTSVPSVGTYAVAPTASIGVNGTVYYGAVLQICVKSINGSAVIVSLKRADGKAFPARSEFKIRLNTARGNDVVLTNLGSPAVTVSLNITESVTWNKNGGSTSNPDNYNDFVGIWRDVAAGVNYYSQAVKVIAIPSGWGNGLAALNSVTAYSNGWGGFSSTDYLTDNYGQKYQCVHYVKKYYSVFMHRDIGNGNANVYWDSYRSHNLTQRVNNGTGIPMAGDIICFKSTTGSYHVGIVAGTVSGKLRVFQENVGQTLVSGNYCSGYKDFTFNHSSGSGSYNVSAGVLGTSWTTLGWVR